MDSHAWFVVARLAHIVFGAFWFGSATVVALFLLPSVSASGPAGGTVMLQLTQVRRMPNYIIGASFVALLSGAYLYWHASGGLQGTWLLSRAGVTFGVGGLLGLVAAALGSFVTSPTAARMGALGVEAQRRGGPPSTDEAATMRGLQARMLLATRGICLLLAVAVVAMALGYYI